MDVLSLVLLVVGAGIGAAAGYIFKAKQREEAERKNRLELERAVKDAQSKADKIMAQAKDEMMKAQEELANKIVEGTSGGGMVKVQMNGKNQLVSLNIDKEVVDPDDIEMLEDLIIAAVNEAQDKITKSSEEEMGKLTGGIKIPGMF